MPPHRTRRRIPDATVARLPVYLQLLTEQSTAGTENISSEGLAELAGVNAAKVRKDLSYLGSYGTRGVGYDVDYLVFQIRRELGLDHDWPVVIVGAGNLGQALAGYGGFDDRGFPVAGIVDIDPAKIDAVVGGAPRSAARRARPDRGIDGHLDRCHRHPAVRCPGRRRPARRRRRDEHLELRPGRAVRAARHHVAQGRSRRRAADPQLSRAAPSGRRTEWPAARRSAPNAAVVRPPRLGRVMSILVIGVNHRSGPLSVLERVTLPVDEVPKAVDRAGAARQRPRGRRAEHLQPHRDLRRRRAVPRRVRRHP